MSLNVLTYPAVFLLNNQSRFALLLPFCFAKRRNTGYLRNFQWWWNGLQMLMLVLTVQFVKPKVQASRGGSKNGPTTPCFGAPGSAEGLPDCIGQVICGYLRLMFVLGCGHISPIPILTSRYKKHSGKAILPLSKLPIFATFVQATLLPSPSNVSQSYVQFPQHPSGLAEMATLQRKVNPLFGQTKRTCDDVTFYLQMRDSVSCCVQASVHCISKCSSTIQLSHLQKWVQLFLLGLQLSR